MKRSRVCLSENLHSAPKGDKSEHGLSFIWPLKSTTYNGIGLIISSCSAKEPVIEVAFYGKFLLVSKSSSSAIDNLHWSSQNVSLV